MGDAAVSSAEEVLSASGITKRFGKQRVLHSVSLSFVPGEVVLLVGANGAGKSTFLRILAGLARPDEGVVAKPDGWRVGLAAHHTLLYGKLSVQENLELYASIIGVSSEAVSDRAARWGLQEFLATPVSELSKGTASKVSLVRSLMGGPQVLLLDEPSSNLDERSTRVLQEAIRDQALHGVCIVATHDIFRLHESATRIIVFERGECVADTGSYASEAARAEVIRRYHEANR
jgi:heme exporter protein A